MDTAPAWSQVSERGSQAGLRMLLWLYRLFGRRFCLLLLYPISLYFFLCDHGSRRASLDYLHRMHALPDRATLRHRIYWYGQSYLHFYEFARALLDKCSVWIGDIPIATARFFGREHLRELQEKKRGAVLIGAHVGNIEVLRGLSHLPGGIVINALMYTKHSSRFNSLLRYVSKDAHLRLIPSEQVSPQLILDLQERLGRGEFVAMLADRLTPGAASKSVSVPFLGSAARFPTGPFILAALLQAPVFTAFCYRDSRGGIYEAHFEPLVERLVLPRAQRYAALVEIVGRFAMRLEEGCRAHPLQWFNFFDFWAK